MVKDQEFEKYLEKIEDPNYQGGSWALPENLTLLKKSKHELCKKVVIYKREKKLNTEEVACQLQLSKAETEDILHYRTIYFTLFPMSEVKIALEERGKTSPSLNN